MTSRCIRALRRRRLPCIGTVGTVGAAPSRSRTMGQWNEPAHALRAPAAGGHHRPQGARALHPFVHIKNPTTTTPPTPRPPAPLRPVSRAAIVGTLAACSTPTPPGPARPKTIPPALPPDDTAPLP